MRVKRASNACKQSYERLYVDLVSSVHFSVSERALRMHGKRRVKGPTNACKETYSVLVLCSVQCSILRGSSCLQERRACVGMRMACVGHA